MKLKGSVVTMASLAVAGTVAGSLVAYAGTSGAPDAVSTVPAVSAPVAPTPGDVPGDLPVVVVVPSTAPTSAPAVVAPAPTTSAPAPIVEPKPTPMITLARPDGGTDTIPQSTDFSGPPPATPPGSPNG